MKNRNESLFLCKQNNVCNHILLLVFHPQWRPWYIDLVALISKQQNSAKGSLQTNKFFFEANDKVFYKLNIEKSHIVQYTTSLMCT